MKVPHPIIHINNSFFLFLNFVESKLSKKRLNLVERSLKRSKKTFKYYIHSDKSVRC